MKTCELCGRTGDDSLFEKHHLVPGKHRRIKVDRKEDTIWVDRACGDAIHQQLTNQQLRGDYNTLESLKEAMAPFISWVRKQPIDSHVCMKMKKKKL